MKHLLIISTLFFSTLAFAQSETEIRKLYTDVNNQIKESIAQGFEGSLYMNELNTNKHGKSWPAVGNYSETTQFWYDDTPDHLPASERNPRNVLVKMNVSRKASHLMSNEEYLFKNGKLLFYYLHEGEEGNEWETRMYFNSKGVMFKSAVKANGKDLSQKDYLHEDYKDLKPNALRILNKSKTYQDIFVKSML